MLYDPNTPGVLQSAATQAILQKCGIKLEDYQASDDAETPRKRDASTDLGNPASAAATPGVTAEQPGEEGDDLPSINTDVKDQRSLLSGKPPSSGQMSLSTPQAHRLIKNLDYKSVLHVIREVEDQIHAYSEVFDGMVTLGKSSIKIDNELKEVLRKAEQDRKLKKYFEQKERDRLEREEKHA